MTSTKQKILFLTIYAFLTHAYENKLNGYY